jgi:hypothetical protein
MSNESLQTVLWRSALDRAYLAEVLHSPHTALQDYDLAPAEFTAMTSMRAHTLVDLALTVEALRRGDPLAANERELALVG